MKKVLFTAMVVIWCETAFAFTAGDCKYKNLITGFLEEGYSYNISSCDPPGCDPIVPTNLTSQRLWTSPDYDWGEGAYGPLDRINYFAIRWRAVWYGSGSHIFYAKTDDGVRGYNDGSLMTFSDGSNCWRDKGVTECSVTINPAQGYHLLWLDYYEQTASATARFGWDPEGTGPKVYPLPQDRFMAQGVRMKVYQFQSGQTGTFGPLACYHYVYSITFPSSPYPWWDVDTEGGCTGLSDYFSVRWTGMIIAPSTGTYKFCTVTDDGVRFYLDTDDDGELELLIDKWVNQGPTEWTSNNVTLTMGPHAFMMEYYENTGGATARLGWDKPGDAVTCDGNIGTFRAIPDVNLVMIDEDCSGEPSTEGGGGGLFGCSSIKGGGFVYPLLIIFGFSIIIKILLLRGER